VRLTQAEFDEKKRTEQLRIALVGMSNIGKSHWARRIKRDHGFVHYEVDDRIQENLSLSSIAKSANWMGHPYDAGYTAKAKQYLELESEMTAEASNAEGNVIIDTTGSVIYLDEEIKNDIKKHNVVIYIKANPKNLDRLKKRFATSPKPLIWGEHFKAVEGVDNHDAMMAQYPSLLRARDEMYAKMADLTMPSKFIGRRVDVLAKIRSSLPVE